MNQTTINPEDDLDHFMADETPRQRLARWGLAFAASVVLNAALFCGCNALTHGLLFDWLF